MFIYHAVHHSLSASFSYDEKLVSCEHLPPVPPLPSVSLTTGLVFFSLSVVVLKHIPWKPSFNALIGCAGSLVAACELFVVAGEL